MTVRVFELEDLRDGYVEVARAVVAHGRLVAPRGVRTLEVGPVTLAVRDPRRVVPVGTGRKLRFEIGAAESCQLVGGVSDAGQMTSITKNFAQFVEAGRLRGAYGPRVYAQFPRIVDLLRRDPDTRQAGVVVWRPWDLEAPSKDVPCTIELHFSVRGGRLDAHATMRSNDVFWGLPYDAWMFANAQCAVAHALGVEVGTYYHTALSLHAYVDRDADGLRALHLYDGAEAPPMLVDGLERRCDDPVEEWRRVADVAAACAGIGGGVPHGSTGVDWYAGKLYPHWSWNRFCPACRYALVDGHAGDGDHCDMCESALARIR